MSEHRITTVWNRGAAAFARNDFARDHSVVFAGGQRLGASAGADYGGNAALADPEQLLLSALSSCHMLTFLAVAANRGFRVDSYTDAAIATLGKDADGRIAVTHAALHPVVIFDPYQVPSEDAFQAMHERSHRACFIAASIRTTVTIAATFAVTGAG